MQWNGNYFDWLAQELRRLPSMGKEYGEGSFNWIERKALEMILVALNRLSNNDQGSEQLLCYEIHVVARKLDVQVHS